MLVSEQVDFFVVQLFHFQVLAPVYRFKLNY